MLVSTASAPASRYDSCSDTDRVGTRNIENLVAPFKTVEVRQRKIEQLQTGYPVAPSSTMTRSTAASRKSGRCIR